MTLPPWIPWMIAFCVPADRREDVLGDLQELHAERSGVLGPWGASWAATLDAWNTALAFFIYQLKEGTDMGNWITWLDIKLALRLVKKRPLLNLTALLALTVGIGIANMGFTVLDSMLYSQLPYERGDRFLQLNSFKAEGRWTSLTADQLHQLTAQADTLDAILGKQHQRFFLADPANSADPSGPTSNVASVVGAGLSVDALRYLPARPVLGRPMNAGDGEKQATPVAMIRESLWRSRFGSDPQVLGRTLNVSGIERSIVGVLPDDFRFPNSPLVWIPLPSGDFGVAPHERISSRIELFAIAKEGIDQATVQAQLDSLSSGMTTAEGEPIRLQVQPYTMSGDPGQIWLIMGAFLAVLIMVLLVLAANVGNLVMVRTAARSSELAVRSALGAGRRRLVGQLFVEVAILVSCATVLGTVLSMFALRRLRDLLTEAPFWLEFSPSPRTVLAAAMAAFLATLAAGLGPALKATRSDTSPRLKAAGRGAGGQGLGRMAGAMTILQMAVSVALVSMALIVARGALSYIDPQLDLPRGQILTTQSWTTEPVPAAGLKATSEWRKEQLIQRREAMLQAVEQIPGVMKVSGASSLPGDVVDNRWVEVGAPSTGSAGVSSESAPAAVSVPVVSVLPGFMETLDVEPLLGRFITESDVRSDAHVAVVNERFVDHELGGMNPLGRHLRILADNDEAPSPWYEIVGVSPDLGLNVANPEKSAGFYIPMSPGRGVELVIKVQGTPESYAGALRMAVAGVHPETRLIRVQPLEQVASEALMTLKIFGGGLVVLGTAALLLSLVGLFTMTSLMVAQRTREIGLRTALGATPSQILLLVSRQAVVHLSVGTLVGSALAVVLLQATQNLESGLPMGRPWELPGVALILAFSALAACWGPARRALRISPARALVEE